MLVNHFIFHFMINIRDSSEFMFLKLYSIICAVSYTTDTTYTMVLSITYKDSVIPTNFTSYTFAQYTLCIPIVSPFCLHLLPDFWRARIFTCSDLFSREKKMRKRVWQRRMLYLLLLLSFFFLYLLLCCVLNNGKSNLIKFVLYLACLILNSKISLANTFFWIACLRRIYSKCISIFEHDTLVHYKKNWNRSRE